MLPYFFRAFSFVCLLCVLLLWSLVLSHKNVLSLFLFGQNLHTQISPDTFSLPIHLLLTHELSYNLLQRFQTQTCWDQPCCGVWEWGRLGEIRFPLTDKTEKRGCKFSDHHTTKISPRKSRSHFQTRKCDPQRSLFELPSVILRSVMYRYLHPAPTRVLKGGGWARKYL